jgi:Na+/H+-dicarboxylate symporter
MMYCTFAVLFIAQAYGIELSIGPQITMLLILMRPPRAWLAFRDARWW